MVGLILTLINQGSVIADGHATTATWVLTCSGSQLGRKALTTRGAALGASAPRRSTSLGSTTFTSSSTTSAARLGFELAAARRKRVASLTILNTMIDVDTFKRPWTMEPFAWRAAGEFYLRMLSKPAFRLLMGRVGVADKSAVAPEELDAYVDLLKREDGGAAFLRIMRGFERTPEKRMLYRSTVTDVPYPVQVVWGELDPALKVDVHGEEVRRAAGLERIHRLPGKHLNPSASRTCPIRKSNQQRRI